MDELFSECQVLLTLMNEGHNVSGAAIILLCAIWQTIVIKRCMREFDNCPNALVWKKVVFALHACGKINGSFKGLVQFNMKSYH